MSKPLHKTETTSASDFEALVKRVEALERALVKKSKSDKGEK